MNIDPHLSHAIFLRWRNAQKDAIIWHQLAGQRRFVYMLRSGLQLQFKREIAALT